MKMEQFTYNIDVITEFFKSFAELIQANYVTTDIDIQINNLIIFMGFSRSTVRDSSSFPDLSVLKLILHVKYNLIKKGYSSKINLKNFDFPIDDNNLQQFREIIKLYISVIIEPTELLKFLLNKAMTENEIDRNYLSLVIESVKCVDENTEINFKELEPSLRELILKGILSEQNSTVICYSLLPLYLKLSNDYGILKEIYGIIFIDIVPRVPLQSYTLLCSISELLFMDFGERYSYDILHESKLWEIIKFGLESKDRKLKNVSLFLLKCSTNTIFSKFDEFDKCIISFNKINKDCYSISWQNFILLFETLDEKQSHIITPVFNLLDSLKQLPPVWEAIIYKQLLAHESSVVQRHGINRILERKLSRNCDFFHFIKKDLFIALNNMYLYQNDTNNEIKINGQLKLFFEQLIQNIPSFFDSICLIESSKWLAVPFFNICYCLLRVLENSTEVIERQFNTQYFIEAANKILNVFIRNGVYWVLFHCFQYIHKNALMCKEIDHKKAFPEILKIFKQFDFLMEKCQIRINSQAWNELKKLFKTRNVENFNEYIFKISARMLLLLYDVEIITEEQFYLVVNKHYEQFSNISTRPSLNVVQLNESCRYLIHLLEEINYTTRYSKLKNDLFTYIGQLKSDLFKYSIRTIETENCDVDDINFYVKAIRIISGDKFDKLDFELLNTCLQRINDHCSSLPIKYFSLSLANDFIKKFRYANLMDNLPEQLLEFLENFSLSYAQTINDDKKLLANFYTVICDTEIIYYSQLKTVNFQNELYSKRIVPFIFKSLKVGGRESISKTMELIKHVLPGIICEDCSDIKQLMSLCWNEAIQLKKSNLFWYAMQQFVQAFIREELLLHVDYYQDVIKYGNDILTQSQQIRGLAKIFYDQIFELIQNDIDARAVGLLIPFIVEGLLIGPSFRRDERVEYDTIKLIKKLQNKYVYNSNESKLELDSVARIRSLEAVSVIKEKTPLLLENIFTELLCTYNKVNRPRYFPNSNLHRIKNRFFQSMLYLQPYFDEDQNERLFHFLLKVLIEESPQQSCRYLMEWLLILIIHKKPSLIIKFEEKQPQMFEKRISSLISVISVTYHLCVLNAREFFENGFNLIAPLTMSSNFNVRLCAQVTLLWLLEKNKTRKDFQIICKKSLRESFEHLKQEFFLTIFNPLEHLTIETIFSDFPRLLNFEDDALDLNYFKKSLFEHFYNTNNALRYYLPLNLNLNNQSEEKVDEQQLNTNMYQKKLIPQRDVEINNTENQEINRSCGELIVVASLINRIPNLGGLCRTCEIFGVKEYIMNNLMHINHKEFQNLSVSAEKWLKITEIKEASLKEYLLEMKRNNYTIIGCEQSNNSVRLNEYKFPKKSVLLLGNEKEGIPPNLLGLIDVCVEIPQCGVIRSLNVHVSGALMIWQYAFQHLFSK